MSGYYESDQSAIGRIAARQAAQQYRQQVVVPDGYQALVERFATAYPYADAKLVASLAAAGQDPADPSVQQTIQKSYEVDKPKGRWDMVGDILSPVSKAIGSVASVAARGLDTALGGLDERAAPAIKAGIRTGFVVLESPLQEAQTFSRAALATGLEAMNPRGSGDPVARFTQNYGDAGSSSARQAYNAISQNGLDDVDLGSGFLPGGEIEQQVKDRAGRLKININNVQFGGPGNPALTLGRAVAAQVSEPGDTAFSILSGIVDAGAAWYGDPTSAVGSLAKTAEVGGRVGRAANVLRDERSLGSALTELRTAPTFAEVIDRSTQGRIINDVAGRIHGTRRTVDTAAQYFDKGGRRVVEKMAETSDVYDLWHATKGKIPIETLTKIADADTPQKVRDVLTPMIGVELRDAPEFLGFKAKQNWKDRVRILGDMPGNAIDPNNLDEAVDQVDRFMRNAKASPELRRKAFDKVARNPTRQTMVAALGDVMGDLADELTGTVKGGRDRARSLTKMWNDDLDSVRTYLVDEIAENRKAIGLNVGGEALPVQSPFLYTEYLNSLIPLPEAREMRRATSTLAKFVDTPFFERATSAVSNGQSAWKRVTLLRGAYTARVIGEEQIRMAASGMDSIFAHPLSFIAGLVSDDGRLGSLVKNSGRRLTDVEGTPFVDDIGQAIPELKASLNENRFGGWVDQKKVISDDWRLYKPGDDRFQQAWAEGIGELFHDPVAREVAKADGNLTEAKDWFWDGKGATYRKQMVESHPELADMQASSEYIDHLLEGIGYRTGGDPTLMEAIATGKVGDAPIGEWKPGNRWQYSGDLSDHLETVVPPNAIKGRNPDVMAEKVGAFDNATSWAFDYLGTKPTNFLSRSQSFKQRYWQRLSEMTPYMTPEVREAAIKGAEDAKLPKDIVKRMRAADVNVTTPIDDLSAADQVAKGWALDQTKDLLYDLTDKGQFFDVFRLLFPFGEAWKEVLTRWASIGVENPKVFRRGQQIITGARGAGFFHKDVNGEETFTYPFSRQLSKMAIGVPIDLQGRVAGLSLMSEVLPGVGPVVQIPAAALIPDTPDFDFVKSVVSPYGEEDYGRGFLESFLPGYAKNIRQYFEAGDPRLFANTVGASMDYLASTGKYDLANPEQTSQLFDDSKDMAKKIYAFRSLAQFVSPTSPMPQTLVKDKDGHLDVARVMIDDFHKMQNDPKIGYDGATKAFLDRYGSDLFLLMQGKSASIAPQLPASKESAKWERGHQGVVDKYKLTWGLFAPTSADDAGLDYQAYVRQFEREDRKTLTPQQRLSLAQSRVGFYLYQQAKTKVGDKPTKVEREWLALVHQKIRDEYPGYGEQSPGLPTKASLEMVVGELRRSVNDPRVSKTRQAQAARLYLAARDKALAAAQDIGVKTLASQAAEGPRNWLAAVGTQITREYPEFQQFYDAVFSREVDTDG